MENKETFNLSTTEDFKSLNEFKAKIESKFGDKYKLYIAPKDKEPRMVFEKRFLECGRPYNKLFNNSFLTEQFKTSYDKIKLTLYIFSGDDGGILTRQDLISFMKSDGKGIIVSFIK